MFNLKKGTKNITFLAVAVSCVLFSGCSDGGDVETSAQNDSSSAVSSTHETISKGCNVLNVIGLPTNSYRTDESEQYEKVCLSNYKEFSGNASFSSNIAYYAYGNDSTLKLYQVTANINDLSTEQEVLDTLNQAAKQIYQEIIVAPYSKKLELAIKHHQKFKQKINGYSVSIVIEPMKQKKYSITLNVKTN